MITFPNAKINLGLSVLNKRDDGFHNIESVFYPVQICDALEIKTIDESTCKLVLSGDAIQGNLESNLVFKAWKILHQKYDIPGVHCELLKKIPMGAGMGGGSADGSFMLKLLNSHFKLNLANAELEQLAGQLGSDCPFFIENKPAFVSGRGEHMERIDLDLSGYHLHVIHPNVHVGTAEAYGLLSPERRQQDLRVLPRTPIEEWQSTFHNDFEEVIATQFPAIAEAQKSLLNQGAIYAAMTGSGSAVFGIFKEKVALEEKEGWRYFEGRI
ncbi:4-(cytidine 5'-diphospho)-2-C-methyl-D-erythritol kinase [Sanyastnella coralliicola]|uniref:4-(cytidine 5'-diphospho)-2-C-methyl-D-erythritol kinase n=1 Tax=Sanyastnella coralliicola TaxID=3069118 RepID=UPI0027B97CE2|nr:4-(cytidine 5'-diphospho)-2-C-methyl-D-erythritol kinase [Longitalea sp. SCSIO 12813]